MRSNITAQTFSSLLYLWDKRTLYIGPLLLAGLSVSIDTKNAIIANNCLNPLGFDFSGLSALMQ